MVLISKIYIYANDPKEVERILCSVGNTSILVKVIDAHGLRFSTCMFLRYIFLGY